MPMSRTGQVPQDTEELLPPPLRLTQAFARMNAPRDFRAAVEAQAAKGLTDDRR